MRRCLIAISLATSVCLLSAPSDGGDRHPITLSTMLCVGNGCPERTYAYHRCDRSYVWSARTHRCVRRVDADATGNRRGPSGKAPQGPP
jgi:hypothetical protein